VAVAMMLGFLKAVKNGNGNSVKLAKNIRIVFQDAEENPGSSPRPESGGQVMVQEGVLNGVSRVYCMHISNEAEFEPGTFGSRPGGFLGNSGRNFMDIVCEGGHVAMPHKGANALRVYCEIVNRLSSFAARRSDPINPVVLEPVVASSVPISLLKGKSPHEFMAAVLAGTQATNVRPSRVETAFGFRTLLPREEHIALSHLMMQETAQVAESMGAKLENTREVYGHPALINSPAEYTRVCQILSGAGEKVIERQPMFGGEDFAWYLEGTGGVPGAMFMLHAHTPNTGDFHTGTFNPDEREFWRGVLFWLLLATS
ncbi:MAG: M20/M25/M40 family metallo-hydrolase, partial [Gemmatimonadaceae bacterium]|nr:M20/M25/M40 family metallo-hydrolase [Gemmatimonadaceae bacterium]